MQLVDQKVDHRVVFTPAWDNPHTGDSVDIGVFECNNPLIGTVSIRIFYEIGPKTYKSKIIHRPIDKVRAY